MYKVCFKTQLTDQVVVFSKHRTKIKAMDQAQKMSRETGYTHFIIAPDGTELNKLGHPKDFTKSLNESLT